MVVAHSHCGACHMSYDHFHDEMLERGVTEQTLDTIRKCGIDLNHWLEGFKDTPESVRRTVEPKRSPKQSVLPRATGTSIRSSCPSCCMALAWSCIKDETGESLV